MKVNFTCGSLTSDFGIHENRPDIVPSRLMESTLEIPTMELAPKGSKICSGRVTGQLFSRHAFRLPYVSDIRFSYLPFQLQVFTGPKTDCNSCQCVSLG